MDGGRVRKNVSHCPDSSVYELLNLTYIRYMSYLNIPI